MFDYGNTGYMYMYERLSNVVKLDEMEIKLGDKMNQICEETNNKLKE